VVKAQKNFFESLEVRKTVLIPSYYTLLSILAYLHDQNKSGFFGGPVFIQPIRAI